MEDFDFNKILLGGKQDENILIYDVLYKSFISKKPLCIIYNKVDGFIRGYGGTTYLVLFGSAK